MGMAATKPLRTAVYLRISSDREHNELGVARQREAIATKFNGDRHQFVGEYMDNDVPGTGRKRRGEFERLMHDVRAGHIDAIVAQEWPRLERNREDGVRIIETCQARRVRLMFVKGPDLDFSDAAGRLIGDQMSSIARFEIEQKAERQSAGQRQRARQGRAPKGMRPLGYDTAGHVIAHEAEAVKAIYSAFAAGSSLRAIAAALSGQADPPDAAEKRIPESVPALPKHSRTVMIERNARREKENKTLPPEQRKRIREVPDDGEWSPSTVLGILRNPRYAGYSTYTPKTEQPDGGKRRSWRASILRDEAGEPVRGQWEPLVDEGVWSDVQDKLDAPERVTNRGGTDRRHLGSGLYRCGLCGERVRAHSGRYRCAGHIMRSRELIDHYVSTAVRYRLGREDLADLLPSRDEPRMAQIREEIGTHRAKIARAQRDYDDEVIEGRDLKRVREKAQSAIAALESERTRLAADAVVGSVLGAHDPVAAFDAADLGIKRSVIDALCEVRLFHHPRGRKGFDEKTVQLRFHGEDDGQLPT